MPQGEAFSDARARMRGCLISTVLPAGLMAGLDTLADCMRDGVLRPFLGQVLLGEIMPNLGLNREALEPMAIGVCAEMERPSVIQPLALLLPNAVRAWGVQALPVLKKYMDREGCPPPCLCMGLATLIMLFAGARREEGGRYTYMKNGEACALCEDEDILFSFSRLSCDMPPESLAYAALSDRALWDEDLRELPGLEDKIADQLRDLQLLGLFEALEGAAAQSREYGA